jgi:hypothetical protein
VHTEAEHRVVRPDGEVRTVQGLGTVKRDGSGRAYEMFGTVQDITDRKRAEEERQVLSRDLEESKAWLEEAQRVTNVGELRAELLRHEPGARMAIRYRHYRITSENYVTLSPKDAIDAIRHR